MKNYDDTFDRQLASQTVFDKAGVSVSIGQLVKNISLRCPDNYNDETEDALEAVASMGGEWLN